MKKLTSLFTNKVPKKVRINKDDEYQRSQTYSFRLDIFSYNMAVSLIGENNIAFLLLIFSLKSEADEKKYRKPALEDALKKNTRIIAIDFRGLLLSNDLLSELAAGLRGNSKIYTLSFSDCNFKYEAEENGDVRNLLFKLIANLPKLKSFELQQMFNQDLAPGVLQGISMGLGHVNTLERIMLSGVAMSDALTTKSFCQNFARLDAMKTYDLAAIKFKDSDSSRAIFVALAPNVLSRPNNNNVCDFTLSRSILGDKGCLLLCQAFAKHEQTSRGLNLHLINCELTDISTLAVTKLIKFKKINFNILSLKHNRMITTVGYKLMLQGYCLFRKLDYLYLEGFHYAGGAELIIMFLEHTHPRSISLTRSGFSPAYTELGNGFQRVLDWQLDHPSTDVEVIGL